MKKYILIGIFGFLGAILRVGIKGIPVPGYSGHIPVNTLFINITGSFVLAFILSIAGKNRRLEEELRFGLGVGFLGAYTTFSTLCKELAMLLKQGSYRSALFYVCFSLVLGMTAAFLGAGLARSFMHRSPEKCDNEQGEKQEREGGTSR